MKFPGYLSVDRKAGAGRWITVFFIRFVVASLLLYILYLRFGEHYARLIAHGASPLLALFGRKVIMSKAMLVTEDISLNPVVFLSLVFAVMKIPAVRKLRGAVTGFVILTAANSLTVAMAFLSYYRGSEALWTGTEFFSLTINFFLPLLLAFVLLPVIPVLPRLGAGDQGGE
jgi:hypothetical protein